MALDDLVQKILKLQSDINSGLEPAYLNAKQAVDDLRKELDSLAHLAKTGGLNAQQYKRYEDISGGALPHALANFGPLESDWMAQQGKQGTLNDLQAKLSSNLQGMSPETASNYAKLSPAADPTAWAAYVGGLRRVPADQIPRAKSIHQQMRDYVRQNPDTTPGGYEEEESRLRSGPLYDAENDPRSVEKLANSRRSWAQRTFNRQNFGRHWSEGGGQALAWAALDLGQGIAGYASQPFAGQRITAEARERSALGLLPGALGTAGALIGGFAGPAGAMIGGGIGVGAGSVISAIQSAKSQEHEALRMASTDLATQSMRGAAAIGQFTSMLENAARTAGTPVAELASSVQSASRVVGTLGAGGVAGVTQLQGLLGDRFPSVFASALHFAQSAPLSQPYRDLIRTHKGDPGLYYGAALYEASEGDLSGAYDQLQLYGARTLTAGAAAATAKINAIDNYQGKFAWYNPLSWKINAPGSDLNLRKEAEEKKLDALNRQNKMYQVAAGPAKDLIDRVMAQTLQTRGLSQAYGTSAETYAAYGQQQLETGMGLVGLAPNAAGEVSDLLGQQATLRQQESVYVSAFRQAPAGAQGWLNSRLVQVRAEIAQNRGQIISARSGVFREGVSINEAGFGGQSARLGLGGQSILMGGGSVFSSGYAGSVAGRIGIARSQAAYDQGLALDHSNFLSPEERQQFLTQAAQGRLAANFEIPNQNAIQRIGETESYSSVRQGALGVGIAGASVAGGVSATLQAQNSLLREQDALRGRLNDRLREGHLTLEQQRQVQGQILDLTRQQIEGRANAIDAAFAGHESVYGAGATSASTVAGRTVRLIGSSDATYAAQTSGYQASMQRVAMLRLRRDTALNPDDRALDEAQYQQAAAGAEADRIDSAGTFSMGPVFQTRQMRLSHRLGRQERSPFEPGSVLQTNAALAKMDTQSLSGIQKQIDRVRRDPTMTKAEKDAAVQSLAGQQESVRDDYFDRQQSVSLGWMDRLTTMSVNAPSFASRIMPPPSLVSSIAEKRGLGPMSARVFGFYSHSSFEGAAAMGMLPSDINTMAYGHRPGDFPGNLSSDPANVDGSGMTLGRIDHGPSGTGLPPQLVSDLTGAVRSLVAAIAKGQTVTVHQINPTTGQSAATTQNATGTYSSRAVQRGGASYAPGPRVHL